MKKIFIILIFGVAFLTCSDDDSSSNNQINNDDNELLYRTWYLVWVTNESNGNIEYPVCENNGHRDYVEFISPNIANFYHIQGSNADNICSDEYVFEPHTFVKNGNEISLYYSNNLDRTWTITELTSTSLKITQTGGFEREYSSF